MRTASAAKVRTERRRFGRCRKRIACRITWDGSRTTAWVCDLSASGLLLQTNLRLPIGATIHVELRAEGREPILVTAKVVRARRSHRRAQGVVQSQVGLGLLGAPESYFQLVGEVS